MTPDELALAIEAKRPELLRIVQSMLRPSGMADDAEDFFQDAAFRILSSTTEYDLSEDDAVGKLLLTTMMRLMFNRQDSVKVRDRGNEEYIRVYQPDSQAHMRQRERLNLDVSLALDKLDPEVREVVRLVWMEDHTWRRTAHTLKISEHTVQADLDEARPILQHELARYDHRRRPLSLPAEDRCLTSQPAYKKEADETDMALPSGGNGAEIVLTETDRRFADHPEGLWIPDEELAWLMAE